MKSIGNAVLLTVALTALTARSNAFGVDDPLTLAAQVQAPEFAQQQWRRLSMRNDRDGLVAALLIASSQPDASFENIATVENRLAQQSSTDPTALFAVALACEMHHDKCADDYRRAMETSEPTNAVNWLLKPSNMAADENELRGAARATFADTRLRTEMALLQKELGGQPAPHAIEGIDATLLADAVVQVTIDQVPVQPLGSAVLACRTPAPVLRADCITIARLLIADKSGSLIARMVGSAMVRRLEKGTAEEKSAIQMRRDYVWLDEQLNSGRASDQALFRSDMIREGEWTAWLRAADRAHVSRQAPNDWAPKNPETLLLSEERSPNPAS